MCDCNLRSCCCCLPIGKSVQIWMVVDVLIHAALASLAFVWGLFPWCAGWLLLTSLGSLSLAVLICRRKVRYQNIKRGEIINLERHTVFERYSFSDAMLDLVLCSPLLHSAQLMDRHPRGFLFCHVHQGQRILRFRH